MTFNSTTLANVKYIILKPPSLGKLLKKKKCSSHLNFSVCFPTLNSLSVFTLVEILFKMHVFTSWIKKFDIKNIINVV